MPRRVGDEEIEIGASPVPMTHSSTNWPGRWRPALGDRLVDEAELEQVVVRHHPVDADDARQVRLVRVLRRAGGDGRAAISVRISLTSHRLDDGDDVDLRRAGGDAAAAADAARPAVLGHEARAACGRSGT